MTIQIKSPDGGFSLAENETWTGGSFTVQPYGTGHDSALIILPTAMLLLLCSLFTKALYTDYVVGSITTAGANQMSLILPLI